MARCAETSANGTALAVSRAITRSAGSPEMASRSGPSVPTVAPAAASTAAASRAAAVRSLTRSPDAAATRSATVVSAITRPRRATTR